LETTDAGHWPLEYWMDKDEIQSIPSFDFWNDSESEKSKIWNVSENGFGGMEEWIRAAGLEKQLLEAFAALSSKGIRIKGEVMDLAAGNLWTAKYLRAIPEIERMSFLEFSWQRLMKLGPLVLAHYGIDPKKVRLVWGSFYELNSKDGAIDAIILSQAFHHAFEPLKLLKEINRVLVPKGVVIIIGEESFSPALQIFKHVLKCILAKLGVSRFKNYNVPLVTRLNALKPMVDAAGDHYYFNKEYKKMFEESGFQILSWKKYGRNQSFVIQKR
jgi:ubiquinone/menaquinone biosynthesis C-methylase UbiE